MGPAIFYAPHQDDESLGMAGAIAQHVAAGRVVFLVLLTDGAPSQNLLGILNGQTTCPWHNRKHDFALSRDAVVQARNREFFAAADALGVERVFVSETGGIPHTDVATMTGQIKSIIRGFEARYPDASHKLVSGMKEAEPAEQHDAHLASWRAADELRDEISDFRFYRVYEFIHGPGARTAERVDQLAANEKERKEAALAQYMAFEPRQGRFAVGYHSTAKLFDAAIKDDREYVDFLD